MFFKINLFCIWCIRLYGRVNGIEKQTFGIIAYKKYISVALHYCMTQNGKKSKKNTLITLKIVLFLPNFDLSEIYLGRKYFNIHEYISVSAITLKVLWFPVLGVIPDSVYCMLVFLDIAVMLYIPTYLLPSPVKRFSLW